MSAKKKAPAKESKSSQARASAAAAPVSAPVSAAKKHERAPKKSEVDLIVRGRKIVAAYLVQRDGMDEDTAAMVVEGMEPEAINELITEANTATIDKIASPTTPSDPGHFELPAQPVAGNGQAGASFVAPEDDGPAPDFLTIPALAEHETFSQVVLQCATASRLKNAAEKQYKELKKQVIAIMRDAKSSRVNCLGVKLSVYTGHNLTLDQYKLLEKGVEADVIKECWKDTPYDDVRVFVTKEAAIG